ASCPPELLRAHAIVSRSWLLAQLESEAEGAEPAGSRYEAAPGERIRWYDRESHAGFDVCADDHCQRYQGISKAFSEAAFDAVRATRGRVLHHAGKICDARYSKSCGGMTEAYRAAWEDKEVPYLVPVYDGLALSGYGLPLSKEENAEAWITSRPPAFCDTRSEELLSRILTGFDQETGDSYRWEVTLSQDELREILEAKLGEDLGAIIALEAIERGESSRIVRLGIRGEKKRIVIGKELEIRRALSQSHLYSSALVVRPEIEGGGRVASAFRIFGAGWGHGVGMCQIGAAVMAERGLTHEEILAHYFRGAQLREIY
ncbi:MAG TPA: SpoIID/LytB domain-containing protein, partial [Blastocatellia bacterium]|nr:SpoIID/LytB domain-containing protein [Blastocatellia bacterium]